MANSADIQELLWSRFNTYLCFNNSLHFTSVTEHSGFASLYCVNEMASKAEPGLEMHTCLCSLATMAPMPQPSSPNANAVIHNIL